MFKNAHFEELGRIGDKYTEMRRAHDDKRKGLVEANGWDSPEMNEWYVKKQQMQDDFNTLFPRGIWKSTSTGTPETLRTTRTSPSPTRTSRTDWQG